jgi:hypothetical protein
VTEKEPRTSSKVIEVLIDLLSFEIKENCDTVQLKIDYFISQADGKVRNCIYTGIGSDYVLGTVKLNPKRRFIDFNGVYLL